MERDFGESDSGERPETTLIIRLFGAISQGVSDSVDRPHRAGRYRDRAEGKCGKDYFFGGFRGIFMPAGSSITTTRPRRTSASATHAVNS